MKPLAIVRYGIRLVPLFALVGIIFLTPKQIHKLGAKGPSTWLSESREARALGRLLVENYPQVLGSQLQLEVLAILREFRLADRTGWGALEPRGSQTQEQVQTRRARADRMHEEAVKNLTRVLGRVPGLIKLGGRSSPVVSREIQMPFGSGLLLVHRQGDEGTAPSFVAKQIDLRWGDRIHVDVPDGKRFFLALEFTNAAQGSKPLTLELVSGYHIEAEVRLTVGVPSRYAVEIEIQDGDDAPTEAAVGLYSEDGQFVAPESALDFSGSGYGYKPVNYRELTTTRYWPGEDGFRRCFFVKGGFQVSLPAGKYRLLASKGPEYLPIDRTFEVSVDQSTPQKVTLKRWIDMSGRGWHSGDCHIHYERSSPAANERLGFWARAEDLRVGNILRMGDGRRTYFEQYAFGKEGRAFHKGGAIVPGQEDPRTNIIGHTISLNLRSPTRDLSRYYLYSLAFDEARRQGGLAGYAHVNMNLSRVERDMTVNVPRRKVDFVEICEFGEIRNTDLYYEFLNLGFRLPAVAGTDIPWAGTLGDSRVYAFTGRGFEPDEWFDAVKQGQTFVTVGPILDFKIDGHRPGKVLEAVKGQQLRVHAKAAVGAPNVVPLSRLELIVNGEVIRSAEPGNHFAELQLTLPADKSMWIVARTLEAHTSPIYVVVDGKRHWNRSQAPALLKKRFRTLDELEQLFEKGDLDLNHEPAWEAPEVFRRNSDEMRQMIAEARVIYRQLEKELQSGEGK